MKQLVKRNLLLFFRDKGSVFFSLLAVFVIIGLYVLFLGDMIVKGMQDLPGARFLTDSWIMAGLLAVTPITTSLGAMSVILEDKKLGKFNDFYTSPLKRSTIAVSYILSGFLISLILTLLTLVLAEVYIVSFGGELMPAITMVKVLSVILLTTASSSFMMFYFVSLFKSLNAYSAASTVTGTLIGFLTGIYIPIGALPGSVQTAIKLFPPSHAASLLRQLMMEKPGKITFTGAPAAVYEGFRLEMGVIFKLGNSTLNPSASVFYLLAFMLVFFFLTVFRISKKQL